MDVKAGLSTGVLEEALVKRALSLRAAETIIMVSSEKLGVAPPYVVMPLDNASDILLERKTPLSFKKLTKISGLDIFV